jgi:hypothetical protein
MNQSEKVKIVTEILMKVSDGELGIYVSTSIAQTIVEALEEKK